MYEKHIGSLIIVDKSNHCKGIFTERDAIRVFAQKVSQSAPIGEVMTTNVLMISEDAPFEKARDILIFNNIRHLPVINKEQELVGLLSIKQLLNDLFMARM